LESLSQGTPVFISNQVGLANYILQNQLGEVTTLNPDEIFEKLTNFIDNTAQRQKIRELAPQKIQQDFNQKSLALAYIQAYQDLKN
jgi:glycosyltransferase involved in cell wall biosynthesis